MKELEKLIEVKKASDKKQRRISILIISISLITLVGVSIITSRIRYENVTLIVTKSRNDSVEQRLSETVKSLSEELKSNIIECVGVPTGRRTINGLPLYDLTMRISDTSIVSALKKVEYYFADNTYNPKLKSSDDSSGFFSIHITNSWGCMTTVPVYLHYKNNTIDTIRFPMCEKIRLRLRAGH
jgi:hypothetical protein